MDSRWKQYLLYAGFIIILGLFIFLTYETYKANNLGFASKTYWDWMELLIIPLFLTGGAIVLNRSEKNRERKLADDRIKEDRRIAEDRAGLERGIERDRQQEAALQTYLDRMAELLIEKKLLSTNNSEMRDVARIRTLTVLRGLDSKRKGIIIKFLYEANLIKAPEPIINLEGAELEGAYLYNANLQDVCLQRVVLNGANMQFAELEGACLQDSYMKYADLTGAELRGAKLQYVNMQDAILSTADMQYADLTGSDMQSARLNHANLQQTSLVMSKMNNAVLIGALMLGADMRGAELQGADLYDAKLDGAIMPDGKEYE